MADLKKFVEEVKELSVVELNDLVKMIEEEFIEKLFEFNAHYSAIPIKFTVSILHYVIVII